MARSAIFTLVLALFAPVCRLRGFLWRRGVITVVGHWPIRQRSAGLCFLSLRSASSLLPAVAKIICRQCGERGAERKRERCPYLLKYDPQDASFFYFASSAARH